MTLGVFKIAPRVSPSNKLGINQSNGSNVTVHVFVMLGKYFVSVKYVFVSVELMCVM
jgi:hypothetical protein